MLPCLSVGQSITTRMRPAAAGVAFRCNSMPHLANTTMSSKYRLKFACVGHGDMLANDELVQIAPAGGFWGSSHTVPDESVTLSIR